MMPPVSQSPAFTDLHPADLTRLAFYALDSALEPVGVHIDCDTRQLEAAIEQIEALRPHARLQMGLNLLQRCRSAA